MSSSVAAAGTFHVRQTSGVAVRSSTPPNRRATAGKRERLAENVAATDIMLSAEDMAAIEAAFPADAVVGGRYR